MDWQTIVAILAAIVAVISAYGAVSSAKAVRTVATIEIDRRSDEVADRAKAAEAAEIYPATHVHGWCEGNDSGWTVHVSNTSDEAVLDVVAYVDPLAPEHVGGPNAAVEVLFGTLPPGAERSDSYGGLPPEDDWFHIPDVDVEFTDQSGRHWLKKSKGDVGKRDARRPMC